MTTVEFVEKQLGKAQNNLDKQKLRKGIQQVEIDALAEKVKHYEVIKSALEKQIPKKVVKHNGSELYHCPNCDTYFLGNGFKHCTDCGQAIDWSDTE